MLVTERRLDNLQKSLKILKELDTSTRNLFIDQMKNDTIQFLIKCINLIIKAGPQLSGVQLRQIRSQARNIRDLASATSIGGKRKVLQRGGFLGAILGPLLGSVVPSLLGAIIPKPR
jgi:hypothetical protein